MLRTSSVLIVATVALLGTADPANLTQVVGQHVRWASESPICLDVPLSFPYVGSFSFKLSESSGARYVFAQRRGQSIDRMVIIQSEHMTTDLDKYRYPLASGVDVGGVGFKINVFAFSNVLDKLEQPNAEAAATVRYLTSKGFQVPDQFVAIRYATHDSAGKDEFLVFYMQPSNTSRIDLADVGPGDFPSFASAFTAVKQQATAIVHLQACGS